MDELGPASTVDTESLLIAPETIEQPRTPPSPPLPTPDRDAQETREWLESLDAVIREQGVERARFLLTRLIDRGTRAGINTEYAVDLYDLDLFDTPATLIASLQAAGKRVICYFSAGSFEDFRPDVASFRSQDLGNPLGDFPNERWLDIRSPIVLAIMETRLNIAVDKGCDGVEPDNMDGFTNNTGFSLTSADQLAFNRTIANEAHERGLSVGLKNDLDQIVDLIAFFDFQVNEQCHEFDECAALDPFITAGKPVFNVEYELRLVSDAATRAQL